MGWDGDGMRMGDGGGGDGIYGDGGVGDGYGGDMGDGYGDGAAGTLGAAPASPAGADWGSFNPSVENMDTQGRAASYYSSGNGTFVIETMPGDSTGVSDAQAAIDRMPAWGQSMIADSGATIVVVPGSVAQAYNGTDGPDGSTGTDPGQADNRPWTEVSGVEDPSSDSIVIPEVTTLGGYVLGGESPDDHEFGHLLDQLDGLPSGGTGAGSFGAALSDDNANGAWNDANGVPQTYFSNNPGEAFAETYAAVVTNDQSFISAHPQEAAYMTSYLSGG